jgi:LysR family glycine cleavage system transcriptional activator
MDAFPPLKALLAFDAAMQHHSFAKAADALSVTPGAVGQQIQNLEAWLGTALFVRTVRQVAPTADALRYWDEVRPALSRIHAASNALRHRRSDEVRLSMPPTLAAQWFAPRMGGFMALFPHIVVHLSATTELADLARHDAALAIRYFDGIDPALEVALLCQDEARLYCAPAYAAAIGLATPDDLARATLLHSTMHPHWPAWMAQFSALTPVQVAAIAGQHADMALLAIAAARQGRGVVLTSALLVQDELAQGALVEPFPCRLALTNGYYLVHRRGADLPPAARQLAQWLLSDI